MNVCKLAAIAILAGVSSHAAECNVVVRIHETVPVPWIVSVRAQSRAAEMFREIGVSTRWHTGGSKVSGDDRSCGAPIDVEFQNTSAGYRMSPDTLGYAAPYADTGTCIHIFMDRVHKQNDQLTAAVLAHVLVHEIGHVLERVSRHSAEGVMKAHWGVGESRDMLSRTLQFAPEDVELIHRGIAGRVAMTASR